MHILFHMCTIGRSWGCRFMHSNECLKAFVILDLQEHTVVFYALPVESNVFSIPAVFFITKTWYKIFSGPYTTDMSLYLYPTVSD